MALRLSILLIDEHCLMIYGEIMRKDNDGLQRSRRWSRIFGRVSIRILRLIIQRSILLPISDWRYREIDSRHDALRRENWHMRWLECPKISRMALDLLTVPLMSAECERLFSITGLMVTKSRNRLDASTIGLCQTLRSWLRAGLISSLDRILMEQWKNVDDLLRWCNWIIIIIWIHIHNVDPSP